MRLVAGTGESGKSTIAKQIKVNKALSLSSKRGSHLPKQIIHLRGYKDESERERFKKSVFGNIVENMKVLLRAVEEFHPDYSVIDNLVRNHCYICYSMLNYLETTDKTPFKKKAAKSIFGVTEDDLQTMEQNGFSSKLAAEVKELWKEDIIQDVYQKRAEFQLNDTAD